MIDCENEIYTLIVEALGDDINVTSEYVKSPASFPHVSVVMTDNYTIENRYDTSMTDNLVEVTFEINVYSNKTNGKKTECKNILQTIDDLLYTMNFTRTAFTPVPNVEDATIYRLTAIYSVVTDGQYFYRR